MSFPRYPAYKDSGVEWLGEVPEHWSVQRFKLSVESCVNGVWGEEPGNGENDVTCMRVADFDRLKLVAAEPDEPTIRSVSARDIEQRSLCNGDLLVEKSGGGEKQPVGAVVLYTGSTPSVCSNFVARMRLAQGMNPSFWRYAHHAAYSLKVNTKSIKQTSGIQNLDQQQYLDERAPFPPGEEQSAIATFLDRETAKIDALIAEQQRLIELAKERIKTLALSGYQCPSSTQERIGRLVKQISRPVTISDEMTYEPLGLYNRGRGLFHKEVRAGNEMGDSDFFMIEDGDLILSGQFAWEGAVALASSYENGCVVSHRYPVIRGRSDCCLTEFLLALLWTDHGDFLLNQCSRGAAGRNRPLNLDLLLKEKIRVPDLSIQELIKSLVWKLRALQEECISQQNLAAEHKKALISAAVTGQIDVRGLVPEASAA
jgi:type I restriction enzyme S subunit